MVPRQLQVDKGEADVVRSLESSLRVVQTVVPCPSTLNREHLVLF